MEIINFLLSLITIKVNPLEIKQLKSDQNRYHRGGGGQNIGTPPSTIVLILINKLISNQLIKKMISDENLNQSRTVKILR